MRIQQDARMFAGLLKGGETARHRFEKSRKGWPHVARGASDLDRIPLAAGDGVAIDGEDEITVCSNRGGEVLLFDLRD